MNKRLIFILLGITFTLISVCFGMWQKPHIQWSHTYHYDLRNSHHRFYIDRLVLDFYYLKNENKIFRVCPFIETKINVDKGHTERKSLGLEAGKEVFKWLYLGGIIQRDWTKEDWRICTKYEKRDYTSFIMKLLLSHYLIDNNLFKLKGFIQEEYTYDFDLGKGLRNEVVIGVALPFNKFSEFIVNWRHIDRIHHYDSDTFEATIKFIF